MKNDFDIYCINLKDREDRWRHIRINKTEMDFEGEIIRMDAIKHKKGFVGCGLSHQKAIKIAKEKKLDKILVIEDDCLFKNGSFEHFLNCIEQLPEDWDVLTGGVSWFLHDRRTVKRVSKNLVKLSDFAASHFFLYKSSSYNKILQWQKDRHIDRYMGSLCRSKKLNVYCSTPFIARQIADFSDVKQKEVNFNGHFNRFEHGLVNIKN